MPTTAQLSGQQHPLSKTLGHTLDSKLSLINRVELQEELDRRAEKHRCIRDAILQLRAECAFGDVLVEIEQLGTKLVQLLAGRGGGKEGVG